MARIAWCLCLILTMLIAGSKRPAVARTVDADPWWGTKEAREIRRTAEQFRAARNFAAAEAVDQRGYELALQHHNNSAAFVYLTAIGAARLYQLQYRGALDAFLEARNLAERTGDPAARGIIAINLAALYLQIWDLDSALAATEEGIASIESGHAEYYRVPLLLQLGRLHQALGDNRAGDFFAQAIEESRRQGDVAQEARSWDLLGEERLRDGHPGLAEAHMNEAFRLRLMAHPADLAYSYARLGAVKLALREWDTAARFTDLALDAERRGEAGLARYLLLEQRGEIRQARGDANGSLTDFRAAVDQIGLFRKGLLPAQGPLVAANVELDKRIFHSFVEAAAEEALRTGDRRLAAESLQAVELNRAASLRESRALTGAWRNRLPAEYWKTLAELREQEFQPEPAHTLATRTSRLRLALAEMEARAAANSSTNLYENFRDQNSLIHFQHGLSTSQLFLSLYLGDSKSYLWAVTRNSLSIHRLPAAENIRSAVEAFRDLVRRGANPAVLAPSALSKIGAPADETETGDQTAQLGKQLYAAWFGALTSDESDKTEWLFSLDGAMFRMPFGALVTGKRNSKMKYLVEQHSLQVVPGALSLIEDLTGADRAVRGGSEINRDSFSTGWFLGLGDPIYNTADPRWTAPPQSPQLRGWFRAGGSSTVDRQWNRLVGSANEVEMSARSWAGGLSHATLLTGIEANRDRFLELASRKPAIIHLATHILTSRSGTADALVAFGLNSSGRSETLSSSEIGLIDVSGAVVALSGCDSGAGDVKAGAGLLGLTRAWQMAGARAVIATGWPVEDTRGELFAAFYRHLANASPEEALRLSQEEMIHSGTWRSSPGYWAAYQLTGGQR